MRALTISLVSCAVTLSSCAVPLSRAPSVEGSVDTVSRAEIDHAIAVAQPYRTDSRGSPAPVRRIRVIDRDHVDICFLLRAEVQACDRLERREGVWYLTGEHEITTPQPISSRNANILKRPSEIPITSIRLLRHGRTLYLAKAGVG